jgi:hypothetical protein
VKIQPQWVVTPEKKNKACSNYPELVAKWNGKKAFSRTEEKSLLRLKLRSSGLLHGE